MPPPEEGDWQRTAFRWQAAIVLKSETAAGMRAIVALGRWSAAIISLADSKGPRARPISTSASASSRSIRPSG